MSKLVKWCFALPLTYILYFVISLILPQGGIIVASLRYVVIIAVFLAVCKKFLSFNVKLFFTPSGNKFSFKKLFSGILFMAILLSALSFVRMLISPQSFTYTFDSSRFYEWLLSLVLIVLAALSEELMFRSYVAHFAELENPVKWKAVLASGLLFAIAHFQNPEVYVQAFLSMAFYFVFGVVLMLYYLKDNSIEFPLGLHIGNNLVAAWFFTYPSAALHTNALFTAPMSVVEEFVACAILLALVLVKPRLFRR